MVNLDNLIFELLTQGIKVESVSTVKNGVTCAGLRVLHSGDRVSPIVYYSDDEPACVVAARVRAVFQKKVDFDYRKIMDLNYVKEHVYIGVQRQGAEPLVKRMFLNLEVIMRVYLPVCGDGQIGTVKVTNEIVRDLGGVSVDEMWECAMKNSRSLYRIVPMGDILGMGIDGGCGQLHVAMSEKLIDAASVICFSGYFRSFCQACGCESCYMLPSSTQEMIVVPSDFWGGSVDSQVLADMVMDINACQVDPVIQLDPCCYRYRVSTDTVEIAAMAKVGR